MVSWAGMRGVVTLAAVFLLPDDTPQRALLALAAFTVVAGTLLIQGLTLPWLVRRLRPARAGRRRGRAAGGGAGQRRRAGRAGRARRAARPTTTRPRSSTSCASGRSRRSNQIWEQLGRSQSELEPPAATYRRLRLQMLSAERGSILEARDTGVYDDEVLRGALSAIDFEESLLDRVEDAAARIDDELVTPEARAGDCEHLRQGPADRAGEHAGRLRGVPDRGHPLGAPAAVPGLRARRLLRLVGAQARDAALRTRPGTRSCAASNRARPGAGATSTTCSAESRSRAARVWFRPGVAGQQRRVVRTRDPDERDPGGRTDRGGLARRHGRPRAMPAPSV